MTKAKKKKVKKVREKSEGMEQGDVVDNEEWDKKKFCYTAKKIRFMYSPPPEMKLNVLDPNFHIHVSVIDLYVLLPENLRAHLQLSV